MRFCVVAIVLGAPGAAILYLMVEVAGIHYLLAGAINCIGMTVLSYVLNSVFTFGFFVGPRGFFHFMASRLGSVAIGTCLYVLLTTVFGVWYLAASLLSAAIASVINFAFSHVWVWNRTPRRLCLTPAHAPGEARKPLP